MRRETGTRREDSPLLDSSLVSLSLKVEEEEVSERASLSLTYTLFPQRRLLRQLIFSVTYV